MQAKRPDSTPVEAHYLAKSWVDRQRLVSRGSKKGEYTIVMNPFAVQRNSIRQEYFSNFRDNSAISERIQHHLTQLLSTLPNETYILPPTGYGDALVDCSDEKKGCRPSACDASSRDVISPSASANVSVNGAGICISAGAGSSSVVTAGGLGLDTLPNQGAASEKPQDTQDGNNNTKQRFSGTLPSSSLTSVGQDMNWPLNGRREETPTPKVHSLSPDPVVMLGTGPTGGADSRVLQTSGRGEVSTSTVTVAASSTCGPEKQGQDCDCSAETMPNRNLAYLLNSKHVRLELDEIPPYTPTPASFQQTMTQDDCGSITDRNQLAEKCTGGVCGGGTCVDLSTKKEKELEINVSGHLDSNSRSESPAGASVGSTAAPGSTAANVHSPIRRAPTLLGEPQAKRPRTDPSLKIDQVGTAYAAGWSGPSGSEPKDRGMQYPSWNLASLPERPLSALGRALGGTVRSPTPADNQSNVQKDNAPPKIPFTHGLGSSTDIARVKAGGSREVDYHQTPFELAPALKGSNNVGMNMSVEESMRNDASNGARLGQQMSKQHSMMGKIEERKDDSVSGNVGSARGAPIVEGSTSDAVESRVESDGNMDMNKDLKMNVNVNMSVNVNLNSHDSSKSMEHPACHGGNGEGGSSGVCAKRSSGLQCDICGITFAKRGNKMRHIATVHDRLKQFQCDYCGMKFGLKADLTRHRVRIHESRAFSCTKCSKSFAEESQLVMHVRVTHEENTKPWECATCHIRFGRKSSLTRHEQTVHQQTRFACSICKKTYSQRFDAIRHARKVHGVVNADKNGCLVLHQ